MKIGPEEVRRVAALARLAFTPAEEELLTVQLDSILQFVEKLNEVDTSAVEPLSHVVEVVNAFRDDRIVNQPATDLLLANAPAREKDFFKVPKIIE
jgi:aspartyl-tRNA(Asn)/glutamyl-tRNA(Gln) amidotransferase subunit C